jgi:hypothetical protein
MSLRDDLLPVFDDARTLIDGLGLRTSRVILRTRSWDGGSVRMGDYSDTDLELVPRPKVREASPGRITVGPITPTYPGGGYTAAQLFPDDTLEGNEERMWIVIGLDGEEREYRVASIDSRRAFRLMFDLESLSRPDPDF